MICVFVFLKFFDFNFVWDIFLLKLQRRWLFTVFSLAFVKNRLFTLNFYNSSTSKKFLFWYNFLVFGRHWSWPNLVSNKEFETLIFCKEVTDVLLSLLCWIKRTWLFFFVLVVLLEIKFVNLRMGRHSVTILSILLGFFCLVFNWVSPNSENHLILVFTLSCVLLSSKLHLTKSYWWDPFLSNFILFLIKIDSLILNEILVCTALYDRQHCSLSFVISFIFLLPFYLLLLLLFLFLLLSLEHNELVCCHSFVNQVNM